MGGGKDDFQKSKLEKLLVKHSHSQTPLPRPKLQSRWFEKTFKLSPGIEFNEFELGRLITLKIIEDLNR